MVNSFLSADQPGAKPGSGVRILSSQWTLQRGLLLEFWILVCLQQRVWIRSESQKNTVNNWNTPEFRTVQVILFLHQATSLVWYSAPLIMRPTPTISVHLCRGHRPTVRATPIHAHRAAGKSQSNFAGKMWHLSRLSQNIWRSTVVLSLLPFSLCIWIC